VNTIAVGAVNEASSVGVVYVLVGSGSAYTVTELQDRSGFGGEKFGASVAVQFAEGTTLIAVGADEKN